jgi:hypothetical protein
MEKIKGALVHDREDDALLEESDKELSADGLGHSGPRLSAVYCLVKLKCMNLL